MFNKSYARRGLVVLNVVAMLCSSLPTFAAEPNGMLYKSEYPIVSDDPIDAYPETREGLKKGDEFKAPGNPYLPLWEFIPDGEPYVFEDPDKPGEQRIYVYGSHDMRIREYCGDDQVVWSANVNDLTTWRYDGKIFENFDEQSGAPDLLYAPDVIEAVEDGQKVYYLYVDNQNSNRLSMVARSDRPDGPFRVVNWKEGEDPKVNTVGPLHFDPGVIIDDIPVYEDGEPVMENGKQKTKERVFAYFGFSLNRENPGGSYFAELDPDNKATLKEETVVEKHIPRGNETVSHRGYHEPIINDSNKDQWVFPKDNDGPGDRTPLPPMTDGKDENGKNVWQFNTYGPDKDENWYKWGFFEASSIRKIGNKYVYIYSRTNQDWFGEPTGSNINQLAYGYSDNPWGPWKFGGIIVDSQGEVIDNGDGTYSRSTRGGNTHGSICKLGDDWYVFYHRNIHDYGRQAMADRLEFSTSISDEDAGMNWIEENGVRWTEESVAEGGKVEIARAEVTSEGFYKDGLDPFEKHSAGIACYFPLDSDGKASRYFTANYEVGETSYAEMPMKNIKDGVVMGVKYFDFRGINENKADKNYRLNLELVPKGGASSIGIYLRPKSAVDTPVVKENGKITSVGEGSVKVATVELTEDMPRTMTKVGVLLDSDEMAMLNDDKYGLFFAFESDHSANICDLYTMQLEETTDDSKQTENVMGEVTATTDVVFTNLATSRALSAQNANRGASALTTEETNNGEPGQKWSIGAVSEEAGNKFYYLTSWSEEMVMCVPNALKTDNAPVSLYANMASADQQWKTELIKVEDGKYYYRIINNNSGFALTALDETDSYKVVQKEFRGEDNQLWAITIVNNDSNEWEQAKTPIDEYKITEKKYYFNEDTINSDGAPNNIELGVFSANQYFYVDTVDADKIDSIAIRAGYQKGDMKLSIYTYDNGGNPLTVLQLNNLKTNPKSLTEIGAAATTKTVDWNYSTSLITKNEVKLTENEGDAFKLDTTNCKNLDVSAVTGKKALIVGLTGNIGSKAYLDNITVSYGKPVLDSMPGIRAVTGGGIIDEFVEIDKTARTVALKVLKGTDISTINPEVITDYRVTVTKPQNWADGTITLTLTDPANPTDTKSETWTVTTEECASVKQYLTAPYCAKHEGADDKTNASLGNTPQIHIAAGATARLAVDMSYIDIFSLAKVSYAQNGGTLNIKLSAADDANGTNAVPIADFETQSASTFDTRVTEEKPFASDITGKKYLLAEITPATSDAWVDYVELIMDERVKEKQYLTDTYCVSQENVKKNQTNESLGNTPQINVDSGRTAKLVIHKANLDKYIAARLSYAQNGGTLNIKLSAADDADGAGAVTLADYTTSRVDVFISRYTEEKQFNSDIDGKEYLIVEVTPTTAQAWIDYVELVKADGSEPDIPTPTPSVDPKEDLEASAVNGSITYKVNCDIPSDAVVYTALYNEAGALVKCDKGKMKGIFTITQNGKYTVKAFIWDENMKPLKDEALTKELNIAE